MNFSVDLPQELCQLIGEQAPQYETAGIWPRVCKQWHAFCQTHFRYKHIKALIDRHIIECAKDKNAKCLAFIDSFGLTLIKPLKKLLCQRARDTTSVFYCDRQGHHLSEKAHSLYSKWQLRLSNQMERGSFTRRLKDFSFGNAKIVQVDSKITFELQSPIKTKNYLSFFATHSSSFLKALLHLNIDVYNSRYVEMNLNFCKNMDFESLKGGSPKSFYCDDKGVFVNKYTKCICTISIDKDDNLTKEIELLNYDANVPKDYYLRYSVIRDTIKALAEKYTAYKKGLNS